MLINEDFEYVLHFRVYNTELQRYVPVHTVIFNQKFFKYLEVTQISKIIAENVLLLGDKIDLSEEVLLMVEKYDDNYLDKNVKVIDINTYLKMIDNVKDVNKGVISKGELSSESSGESSGESSSESSGESCTLKFDDLKQCFNKNENKLLLILLCCYYTFVAVLPLTMILLN